MSVVYSWQDYQGGRDFSSLKKFAEENLGPPLGHMPKLFMTSRTCGPANLDLCSEEMKKKIEGYMAGLCGAFISRVFKEIKARQCRRTG